MNERDNQAGDSTTPADLRQLAVEAMALCDRIVDAQRGLIHHDERRTGHRLPGAAIDMQHAVDALHETADYLTRARTARDAALCGTPWGICPDHGEMVWSAAGESWCRAPDCGRTWAYDRYESACQEPVTHRVVDLAGTTIEKVCYQHAKAAADGLDGATIDRISPIA